MLYFARLWNPWSESWFSVLLAEDDAPLRTLARLLLESNGAFRVGGEATDGTEAVAFAAENQPDLVLLDVAVPVLHSIDVLPRIRAQSPPSRVAVHSTLERDLWESRVLAAGADLFLDKSTSNEQFIPALMDVVGVDPTERGAPAPRASVFPRDTVPAR